MEKNKEIIILIPARNENKNLQKILPKLIDYNVLVVDDESTDGTLETLKKFKINYIKNIKKLGYEKTLIFGFKYIIKKYKKVKKIITFDGDGEHKVKNLKKFIKEKNYDFIVGRRDKYFRTIELIISKIFYFKSNIYDPLSGLKLYNVKILKLLNLDKYANLFLVDLAKDLTNKKIKFKNIKISTTKRTDNPRVGGLLNVNFKLIKILLFSFFN